MGGPQKRRSPRKPSLITKPVEAFVGPVEVRLFAYDFRQTAVDDGDEMPWAWLASCRVKLRIDGLTCTKRLRGGYRYTDHLGWPQEKRPHDSSLRLGLSSVTEQIKCHLDRLGLKDADLEVVVKDEHGEPWPSDAIEQGRN